MERWSAESLIPHTVRSVVVFAMCLRQVGLPRRGSILVAAGSLPEPPHDPWGSSRHMLPLFLPRHLV